MLASSPMCHAQPEFEFFEKKIRPLLEEHCLECHGPLKQKGGLRLDSRQGWMNGGDLGVPIVPGDPARSRLLEAIRWENPDLQMPPKNRLPERAIADVERWIREGAVDPRMSKFLPDSDRAVGVKLESPRERTVPHWAYQPVRSPSAGGNLASRVDHAIETRLSAEGRRPVERAASGVLLRRLHFDLTGLPPTETEQEQFERETAADPERAWAAAVDRLLASPRFGERWGRHWLDVVRYAESVTLRGFLIPGAWRYRDWIIESFNRDLPFDEFVRRQIAGDLLPARTRREAAEGRVSTIFLLLGNTHLEEQDKRQLDMDVVDEQLDVLGKAFLGQTIGCARCHDHKFDPIPTRDYYALAGILAGAKVMKHANVSEWNETEYAENDSDAAEWEQVRLRMEALREEVESRKKQLAALKGSPIPMPSVVAAVSLPGRVVDDRQVRLVGDWKHSIHSGQYVGDGYWHDDNAGKGSKTATFAAELPKSGHYEVKFAYQHGASRATNVAVTVFHAGGETVVWVNEVIPPADGRFVSLGTYRFEAGGQCHVLVSNEGTQGHVTADAMMFVSLEEKSFVVGGQNAGDGKGKERESIGQNAASLARAESDLKRVQEQWAGRPRVPQLVEGSGRDLAIHRRGSVHHLGEVVPRGFLNAAWNSPTPAIPKNESGRRELAEWVASVSNPLTARVWVNRVWQWMLGEGLVVTPDNFGTTGEAPTHPELLDEMASEFMRDGWATKRLIRQIAMTETYRRRVRTPDESREFDAGNRWWSGAIRRRLDAECLRDAMLQVSGRLEHRMKGPGYPGRLTADYGFKPAETRRSVYLPVFRNALPELFEAFDFPDPSMVSGRRSVSTVAPQALFLLNHPSVREEATHAARRFISMATTDSKRVDSLYQQLLGRRPTLGESDRALRHLSECRDRDEGWTELVHVLFSTPDFRYIE